MFRICNVSLKNPRLQISRRQFRFKRKRSEIENVACFREQTSVDVRTIIEARSASCKAGTHTHMDYSNVCLRRMCDLGQKRPSSNRTRKKRREEIRRRPLIIPRGVCLNQLQRFNLGPSGKNSDTCNLRARKRKRGCFSRRAKNRASFPLTGDNQKSSRCRQMADDEAESSVVIKTDCLQNGEDPRPIKNDSASKLFRLAKSRRKGPLRRAARSSPSLNSCLLEPRTSTVFTSLYRRILTVLSVTRRLFSLEIVTSVTLDEEAEEFRNWQIENEKIESGEEGREIYSKSTRRFLPMQRGKVRGWSSWSEARFIQTRSLIGVQLFPRETRRPASWRRLFHIYTHTYIRTESVDARESRAGGVGARTSWRRFLPSPFRVAFCK